MKHFFILLSVILITFYTKRCFAKNTQIDTLVLHGSLAPENSSNYKFKIIVNNKTGKWDGYSILDEGGPNETKSTISIEFLNEKKALLIAERKLVYSKSKEKNFCFVGALLKINGSKNLAKGYFVGQDEKKKVCGSGSITLSLPSSVKKLLYDLDAKSDTTPKTSIITSQKSDQIIVKQNEVSLEFWDGGLEDNDSISIMVNNQIIESAVHINKEIKRIKINLQSGENVINITALNEGTQPPNSARFSVIENNKHHPIVSFLRKGESAQIKIKVKP